MSMTIDCGTCTRQQTSTCDDCVVSFIVSREPEEAVVIDVAEFSALRRLQSAGLVPDLLHDAEGETDVGTGSPSAAPVPHPVSIRRRVS
ncbi:MAG: hypothetical protein AAF547_20775 [Actinomycetota bacterium]